MPPANRAAGDLAALKSRNRAILLECLRHQPGLTRAELAQRTTLTKVTVGAATQTLLDQGWLVEGELQRGGNGRPGRALALNPDRHAILGAEIGVHGLHVLAMNLCGDTLAERHVPMVPGRPEPTLDRLAQLTGELLEASLGRRRILGIGLAVPGPTSPEQSRLSLAPNLGWRDVPLLEMLKQRLPTLDDGTPRRWSMDNEAKAAAFGELYCSPSGGPDAPTPSSLLYVSAATGIGSGLVVQGTPPRVIRGVHGLAGEIGHTLLAPGGKPCHCGNHGCAETLVSGWALRDALGIDADASLSEGIKHHRDPDLVAETLHQAGEALGLLLLNLHLTLNPGRIVIGGSLVKLGAPLLDPALAFFTRHQNHLLPQAPPIPVRILDDSLATAARGAAAQVLCQLLARHDEFATDE